jgi:PhnB protein
MTAINPYLNFAGNTEEAFNFYKFVFGGEFAMVQRFKDTQQCDQVPDSEKNMIMHISLPVGKGNILMATDALESMGHKLTEGNNFSLCIDADSEAEADKLFKALSDGAVVTMPLEKAFWGAYFGMLTDKFGIQWMVNYDYNKNNEG